MNNHTLGLASFGNTHPARVGGVDVDQLLRDIGEASASTSPIELFRLCLSAQRVLLQASADAHPSNQLTDADYAATVKRYEDAGDVTNADIIRKQWEVARAKDADSHPKTAESRMDTAPHGVRKFRARTRTAHAE